MNILELRYRKQKNNVIFCGALLGYLPHYTLPRTNSEALTNQKLETTDLSIAQLLRSIKKKPIKRVVSG